MTKRISLALAFVAAISLGSCTTLVPAWGVLTGGSVASQAPATMLAAEKALILAHYSYDGIGIALRAVARTAANPNGPLHGTAAATANQWYDKAGDALKVGDQADAALNAKDVMDAIDKANTAIIEANHLVKP